DVVESVRDIVFSAMTVLNLQLEDHLVPTLPFQMARVLGKNKLEFEDTIWLGAYNRSTLTVEQVSPVLGQIAKLLGTPRVGPKLLVALELYAAHLIEQQPRVRFLLLVIALEACADVELKHDAALDMLDRWKAEITTRLLECDADSDEYHSLQALAQQLFHRRQESIGNQIRKIFANLGKPEAEAKKLQRRAMALYGKRSDLVHKGYLPYAELSALEGEARELLEMIFHHALESSRQR
ncbi:MAG: hypothetical protein ACXWVG_02165, partial [Telluria sp.]